MNCLSLYCDVYIYFKVYWEKAATINFIKETNSKVRKFLKKKHIKVKNPTSNPTSKILTWAKSHELFNFPTSSPRAPEFSHKKSHIWCPHLKKKMRHIWQIPRWGLTLFQLVLFFNTENFSNSHRSHLFLELGFRLKLAIKGIEVYFTGRRINERQFIKKWHLCKFLRDGM